MAPVPDPPNTAHKICHFHYPKTNFLIFLLLIGYLVISEIRGSRNYNYNALTIEPAIFYAQTLLTLKQKMCDLREKSLFCYFHNLDQGGIYLPLFITLNYFH